MTDPQESPRPRRRVVRWIGRMLERGLAIFGLATIVYFSCFNLSRITSGSMAPTLRGDDWSTGDLVLTERVSYWFRQPQRWEVVTFRTKDGDQVMKRVFGLPGETVQMCRETGTLRVSGKVVPLPESLPTQRYYAYGNLMDGDAVPCRDGYYVLGDDSRDSDDSRFNGPVPPSQLAGRAWLILAPKKHRGFVNVCP